jgi:hypothetical protein
VRFSLRNELSIFTALFSAGVVLTVLDGIYAVTGSVLIPLTGIPAHRDAPLSIHVMNIAVRGVWAAYAYGFVMRAFFGRVSASRVSRLWFLGLAIIALLGAFAPFGAISTSTGFGLCLSLYLITGKVFVRDWVFR